MKVSLDGQAKAEGAVLVLGMFDGVHLGHRVLLRKAKVLARRQRVPLVACTFTTHPKALVAPEKCPPMLTTLEERAKLMEAQGVDILHAQPFDREVMKLRPEEYIGELCGRFHPRTMVVGYNYAFGRNGEGNPCLLEALGQALGFSVEVVPQITWEGQEISASVIREMIGKGNATRARELLGRPYVRQAAVAQYMGEKTLLVMEPNGKQNVPAGNYRVMIEVDGKCFPATLVVRKDGHAETTMPASCATGEGVNLLFYR